MKRPVALTMATILFFVFSVAFCALIEVPEITSAKHLRDVPLNLGVIIAQLVIGIGLVRLNNWARIWAVFFFVLSGFFTLFTLVMWWNGQADISLGGLPARLLATVEFCGIITCAWAVWILSRKNVHEMFKPALAQR